MWKKVEDYALNFHNTPRRCAIHLKLADGSNAIMDHLTIDEFTTLGTILQHETQVWYHSTRGDLTAHSAPQYEEGLD